MVPEARKAGLFENFGNEFGAAEENKKPDQAFDQEKHETRKPEFLQIIFHVSHGTCSLSSLKAVRFS